MFRTNVLKRVHVDLNKSNTKVHPLKAGKEEKQLLKGHKMCFLDINYDVDANISSPL